ncbi:MAG: hypothetical protein ACE5FV_10920 [Woeseia sp.]
MQQATGVKEIDEIGGRFEKLSKSGESYVITLDNGQVWRQTDASRLRLAKDDQVTIERAAFGSFRLKKVGRSTMMRVKRIS